MEIVLPSVELWSITPNALALIERAGRVAHQSKGDEALGPEPFVRYIIGVGHESVIEHAVATFSIVCDRGVTHEIVRHRIASYTQESTRYCNYAKGKFGAQIKVIQPPGLGATDLLEWGEAIGASERTYLAMVKRGVKPQIARSVLPNCLRTQIVMTANFREWRHFLHLRTAPVAHPQMVEVAKMIEAELVKQCAVCFEDIARCYPDDGTPPRCRYCGQPIRREPR